MTANVQPPNNIQPLSSTGSYTKSRPTSGTSSTPQTPSKLVIPHITFESSQLSPTFSTNDDSIYKHSKKHRTYSDARRRGSSRLTLDEVPELDVLEPEPVWEDDEADDIEKPGKGERRLGLDASGTGSTLAVVDEYAEGEELRRTTTAPAVSRPVSQRRERLAPGNGGGNGNAWPRVKRMGLGGRSKSYQPTSPTVAN